VDWVKRNVPRHVRRNNVVNEQIKEEIERTKFSAVVIAEMIAQLNRQLAIKRTQKPFSKHHPMLHATVPKKTLRPFDVY
jgi:hypothetical protein